MNVKIRNKFIEIKYSWVSLVGQYIYYIIKIINYAENIGKGIC